MSAELTAWLYESIVLFIQVSVTLVWLFGLLLALKPSSALALQQRLNKRFSARKASRPLEIPINIDRYVYRHSRPVGIGLILGSLGLLVLNWQLPGYVQTHTPALWLWLADALYWFLWLSGISIFFIGLACFFRPSLLKPLESKANQWISTRQKTQFMSHEYSPLDIVLQQNPRLIGMVILAVSSLLLLVLIRV